MNATPSLTGFHMSLLDEGGSGAPHYVEERLAHLEPDEAFRHLSNVDWSFSEDDTRFLAHDIHPYPAKFVPQIPGNIISRLSARGELVMDCFGGSGTTALEAVRLGRRALSIDANPLSALIGRVKTASVEPDGVLELHGLQAALAAELTTGLRPDALMLRYGSHAPAIPNRAKWFADTAFAELCLIKGRISEMESAAARDIALVALSRIALRASFQDSETRYKSVVRQVPSGDTLKRYLRELRAVTEGVAENEASVRYGVSRFICADARHITPEQVEDGSVDLLVTSPPYGNATDYHLYHRFRLLWLGFDPVALGKVEIGSHLKHQREASGFDSYYTDLAAVAANAARVLRSGRYAALVLGNSVYNGETHDPAERLRGDAAELGFDSCFVIERPVHATKRSFAHAGRRATSESIVILRKRAAPHRVVLEPPPYRLWAYERNLRLREAEALGSLVDRRCPDGSLTVDVRPDAVHRCAGLVFSHRLRPTGAPKPTWQAIIENGAASNPAARKDPKYVTHGLHAYKGKFYPQLAKGLLNLTKLDEGARVVDPFCGSGTTLLESYLNGFEAFGIDMNPIAAKIATAKTEILEIQPDLLTEVVSTVTDTIKSAPNKAAPDFSEFRVDCMDELVRWFPVPVAHKINFILKVIRKNSAGSVRDFLEIILSSIIREVSQQEPTDLRIRYRRTPISDADVVGLFLAQMDTQYARIVKFWKVRGWAPSPFHRARAVEGDNRSPETFSRLGLEPGSVDLVLTSPPYGAALPYIDTDRLSLLTIMGVTSAERRPLEVGLTGSREITTGERRRLEGQVAGLPKACQRFVDEMRRDLAKDASAGFRKLNMPALTARYLEDMDSVLRNVHRLCKPGAEAMLVIGDNRIVIGGRNVVIPTTDLVSQIAKSIGFKELERIDISVTTENMLHVKNAITENVVLRLRK